MEDKTFERLLAMNPEILDEARAVARKAMDAIPQDLRPEEEPAHIYQADAVHPVRGDSGDE